MKWFFLSLLLFVSVVARAESTPQLLKEGYFVSTTGLTPTAGFLAIADGTSFKAVAMSGGATISSTGVVTLSGGAGLPVKSSGAGTPTILNSSSTTITGTGNTIAFANTAAGATLASGTGNTLLGNAADVGLLGSNNGVAVGNSAVCPSGGIAIGYFSGAAGATASNFTGVGPGAGGSISSGADNSFFGSSAGSQTSTSPNNTFIGSGAGNGMTTDAIGGSTMLGYKAGFSTTGSLNTLLGASAAQTLGTGTANVVIGNSADVVAASTTGAIILGNAATGASNDFVAGSTTQQVSNVYFGQGKQGVASSAGVDYIINGNGGGGTTNSQNGGNLNLAGGKGTGAGTPGILARQYPRQAAASTTLQALTEKYQIPGVMFTVTSDVTLTGSTATTGTLLGTISGAPGASLAGGMMVPGRQVRIKAYGKLTSSVAGPTIKVDFKFGSYAVCSTGAVAPLSGVTGADVSIEAVATCRIFGAANVATVQGDGVMFQSNPTTFGTQGYNMNVAAATSASLDLTANNTLDLFGTWSANTAGNSITISSVSVEIIN